ncbi:MAG: hypothetical protein PHV85_02855 [Desulfovibrionaceae bacterium]|nr:hypothetical protein [Desulfovibrionaceae bacterium]
MKKTSAALILIGPGVILGFPIFSMAYYNNQGFVAERMDRRLPAPRETSDFFCSNAECHRDLAHVGQGHRNYKGS